MSVVISPNVDLETPACGIVRNLAEFEALPFDPKGPGAFAYSDCMYALGLSLFEHLYRVMDGDNFRLGLQRLSLHIGHDAGDCNETDVDGFPWTTVCHVRDAFTHAGPPSVGEIIDLHYDGIPPHIAVTVTGPGSDKVALDVRGGRYQECVDTSPTTSRCMTKYRVRQGHVEARSDGTASVRVPAETYEIGVKTASINEHGGVHWSWPVVWADVVFDGLTTVQVEIDL